MKRWATAGAALAAAYVAWAYNSYRNQNPNDVGSSTYIDAAATVQDFFTGGGMHVSAQGRQAITDREGYERQVYADEGGKLTAGIGHLLRPADGPLREGDTVTDAQIAQWFNADIAHAENTIALYVKEQLNQAQYDAVASAVFNMGSSFFRNGNGTDTHVLQYLNAGNFAAAAAEFPKWDHVLVNGVWQESQGLKSRRLAEQAQFNGVAYG